MEDYQIITIIIAGILLLIAYYLSRPEQKARMRYNKEKKKEQAEKQEQLAYEFIEREEQLKKRIKELEMEVELLTNSIKYGNISTRDDETPKDNTFFYVIIIVLIAIIVFLALQLNERHQTYNFINELFRSYTLQ